MAITQLEIVLLLGALALGGFAVLRIWRERQSHRQVRFDIRDRRNDGR